MVLSLRNTLLAAVATLALSLTATAAPQTTVRNVNTDLDTTNIIVPESFEVDVHNLMTDWYLQRYAVMDTKADSRPSVTLTDRDYIERLQKLPTTIEMPYNSIVGSMIRMYVERRKGLVESMLGLSIYYMPIFEDAFDRYGMPMELRNLAVIESALNPNAVSKAGATGLWQFMASTAQGEGLEVNSLVDERRDPYKSTDAAARYLKKLYDIYGDWSLAIAAYNCGPGNVNKAIRRAGGGKKDFWEIYNYLPAETRTYIPAFIAANYAMNYYKDHNISPVLASKPIIVDQVPVNRRVHFQQISDVLGIPMDEIRALNPQYRADVIPGDIKEYTLVLPHMQSLCYVAYEDSIVNHDAELYARREVVDPGQNRKITDDNGVEYIEVTNVVYHKVRSGETVAAIAQKYGVTQSEVIRANGGRKTLKRGRTLQLNVVERRPVTPANPEENAETPTPADRPDVESPGNTTPGDSVVTQPTPPAPQPTPPTPPKPKPTQTTITHVVKSGDNLTKLAAKYGVTVDAIMKANNLKSDKITIGSKLKIPAKTNSRRRRR